MAFWVYILRCSDGSYYTGHTDNLEKRIAEHKAGEIPGYTFTRRPVELVFEEVFQSREEALAAELQIKGWSMEKKEAMIRGDWDEVQRLAAGRHNPSRNHLKLRFLPFMPFGKLMLRQAQDERKDRSPFDTSR